MKFPFPLYVQGSLRGKKRAIYPGKRKMHSLGFPLRDSILPESWRLNSTASSETSETRTNEGKEKTKWIIEDSAETFKMEKKKDERAVVFFVPRLWSSNGCERNENNSVTAEWKNNIWKRFRKASKIAPDKNILGTKRRSMKAFFGSWVPSISVATNSFLKATLSLSTNLASHVMKQRFFGLTAKKRIVRRNMNWLFCKRKRGLRSMEPLKLFARWRKKKIP